MKKLILLLLLLLSVSIYAQQAPNIGRFDGFIAASGTPNGPANVAVCTQGGSGGPPCSPIAVIYSDQSGTGQQANPFSASITGRYTFFAPAGTYVVQTYGTGYTTTLTTITIKGPSSGGGGSTTGGGNQPGVFNLLDFGGVDDDSTDNCANNSVANFTAAVNAYSGPGKPIAIIPTGTNQKAFKLATNANSCTFAFTRTAGVVVQLWGTIDCAQTAISCMQFGPTGQGSIVLGENYTLVGNGVFYGGANLTTAGVYFEPGVNIINVDGVQFYGPAGGTTNTGFGANNATLGNCTNYSIFIDTPMAAGTIRNITDVVSSSSTTVGGCGISNASGGASGANTIWYQGNTVATVGAVGGTGSCGSQGIIDGGSYGQVLNNNLYGFGVPVRIQGIGLGASGNNIDSTSGCTAHAVNAAFQVGQAGSSTGATGITLENNTVQVGASHTTNFIAIAGDSTGTVAGLQLIGNKNSLPGGSIGPLMPGTMACTPSSSANPCLVIGNSNFSLPGPSGSSQTGWMLGIGNVGAKEVSAQTANLGSTLLLTAPVTRSYLVACRVTVTTAGTTSTLPSCLITNTDLISGVSSTQTITATSTTNTVGTVQSGMILITVTAGNSINISTTGYASTGTAMAYDVFAQVFTN